MQDLWIQHFIPKLLEVTEESARGKLDTQICFSELNLLCVEVVVYLLTHARLCATLLRAARQLLYPWNSPGKNTEWVPILFFHFTSSFSNFVNILFLFQAHLFCLCWVLAVSGLSLVAAAMPRLLLAVASLVLEHRLQKVRTSIVMAPRLKGTGSVVVAHGLSCSEASSGTWDGTRTPKICRHTLSHYTTRELPNIILFQFKKN